MDYQKFYNEIVQWINQANYMAVTHGIQSNEFWTWVTRSEGELCVKYNNNPLVIKQMVMLHEWLEEIYFTSKKKSGQE